MTNTVYRSLDEVPDHIRKRMERLHVTTKTWCGLLFFCCPFPYCLTESENALFLLQHAAEHGIYPEDPAAAAPETPLEIRDTIDFSNKQPETAKKG